MGQLTLLSVGATLGTGIFVVLEDGRLPVPRTPGIGVEPLPEALRRFARRREDLCAG
ncbi:hypothetical protein [Streptomyces sp. NPDC001536]|uniref:hypothetical protein n=1 Tax=Streptomyces sp. NPDC001536 TaxID=3364583 RepID=UPI00368B5168